MQDLPNVRPFGVELSRHQFLSHGDGKGGEINDFTVSLLRRAVLSTQMSAERRITFKHSLDAGQFRGGWTITFAPTGHCRIRILIVIKNVKAAMNVSHGT